MTGDVTAGKVGGAGPGGDGPGKVGGAGPGGAGRDGPDGGNGDPTPDRAGPSPPGPAGATAVPQTYADLAARVLAGPPLVGRTRLVAVDGPSGAGKTRFAAQLEAALNHAGAADETGRPAGPGPHRTGAPGTADARSAGAVRPSGVAARPSVRVATVVHTDDLLDGWDDQLTFWPRLERTVLEPLRAGRPGVYHRYSWLRREFTPRPVTVEPTPVVIVEGFSAARAAVRPELSLAVFVVAPADLRLDRALARDGVVVRPHLRRWRRNEGNHFRADRTVDHADLVVDGAPGVSHDPAREYVRLPAWVPIEEWDP